MPAVPGKYHDTWENRTGPGDARPTALQIVKDEDRMGKMTGLTAVITGCSNGLGVETLRALHAAGMTCFATARKPDALAEVVKKIAAEKLSDAKIYEIELDLASFESVRKGAGEINGKCGGKVNVLVNNAGVMATPFGKTSDGWETQFGTNHLGHFLLFQLIKPALIAGSSSEFQSRVVSVSSTGHRGASVRLDDYNFEKGEYTPWGAYGQAKTANIWMANEIARRYGGAKGVVQAYSLHPGGILTGLGKHLDEKTIEMFKTHPAAKTYMKDPEQGAATQVWAAVGREWEGKSGKWLSNVEEWTEANPDRKDMDGDDGFVPHAFDEEGAKKLWADSCRIAGVENDDE